ncbi:MAG: DUF2283 domain-containing protein [Deltaproteobacteria bacterium]|nr:DUF2283 domain-containing protein [Deltaproteobacteria bacterium]
MDAPRLTFHYDRAGDILTIARRPPHAGQECEDLGDDVVARVDPATGEVEGIEVLFFSTRLLRSDDFALPIEAELRRVA